MADESLNDLQGQELLRRAKSEFPILNKMNFGYLYNPKPDRGFLEYWPQGEGGAPDYPRPREFPMDSIGIEVYDRRTRPMDIMGDITSHGLIYSDPEIMSHYETFKKSLTPRQKEYLKKQYEHSGDKRPYKDWEERSGLPAYFRGYAFQQWDRPNEMYTTEQMRNFDRMMQYLRRP